MKFDYLIISVHPDRRSLFFSFIILLYCHTSLRLLTVTFFQPTMHIHYHLIAVCVYLVIYSSMF